VKRWRLIGPLGALLLAAMSLPLVLPQSSRAQAAAPAAEVVPKFDQAYLASKAAIATGEEVWNTQCRHCHGRAAYPGKAPKLKPGTYDPEFIFDRVTNGFGKMPAWKEVFTLEQRKGVVAYVKSDSFSP
jgi:mono/diheme cytochrome c family protein